jgi:hypothetical protein
VGLPPDIRVRLTAEDTGVSAAIKELSVQLQDLKRQDDATARSADGMASSFMRASGSMREARGSARLLSADLGVGLNRELASTLARSATLGPILAAAFPVVAAIGFFEVIKHGAEELATLISDTFIYTKAEKAAYEALVQGNKELAKSVEHTKTLKEEFELIGVTGIAKDTILLQRMSDELLKVQQKQRDAENVLFLNRREGLGTPEEVTKAQQDLLAAKTRGDELTQEQYNLEKEILVQQQKDRDAAATKVAQTEIKLQERRDANLAREASSIRVGMQNELELYKVGAKEREGTDQNSFDRGLLTIREYYAKRRETLQSEETKERAIMAKEIADAQAEADRLGAEGRANQAKSKKAGGPDTEIGAAYAAAAEKDLAGQETNAAKVTELKTKAQILETEFRTKRQELDRDEFRQTEENQTKVLEFDKLVEKTKNDGLAAALDEIEIEKQKLVVILEQSGASKEQIAARLASYSQIRTAQATFDAEQKSSTAGLKILGDERAEIEDKVKNGKLFQAQADEQIRALELARLPVLQQIAAALLKQAQATGDQQKIAQAEDFQKQVNAIAASADIAGQQMAKIKEGIQSSLTGGIEQFFGTLMEGTRSVGQAFRGLAQSVVGSLARMMAQMVAQMIVARMLKAAISGFSGGGPVPGAGGGGSSQEALGLAGGGLIQGSGTAKSDSIPARLSTGEYVVQADAVKAFGAANLEAINRGLRIPSLERLSLPKFAEGGLVGAPGAGGGDSNINLGISLDEGLILKHLSSKTAGNIILNHLANNPKAASKALSRSM